MILKWNYEVWDVFYRWIWLRSIIEFEFLKWLDDENRGSRNYWYLILLNARLNLKLEEVYIYYKIVQWSII